MPLVKIRRNGMTLECKKSVRKDSFVRTTVTIDTDFPTPYHAWHAAVKLGAAVFGVTPTEDNTVGQVVQLDGASNEKAHLPAKGRVFQLSFNLYGMGCRKINARIKEYSKPV